MRKGRRVLIGLLCMVLLLTNTLSSELRVFAVENANDSQNMENIVDEAAGSASSDEGVENKDSQPDDPEEESDQETTPEEPESENQEQEESENKEAEEDVENDETDDSERDYDADILDETEQDTYEEVDDKVESSIQTDEADSDGSVIDSGSYSNGELTTYWSITSDGTLSLWGNNYIEQLAFTPWKDYKDDITKIVVNVLNENKYKADYFSQYTNVEEIDFQNFICKSMGGMFADCSSLKTIKWGNITFPNESYSLYHTFWGCSSLETIDLSGFNLNVSNLTGTFTGCKAVKEINISGLDTSSVTSVASLFRDLDMLETVTIGNMNLTSATSLSLMFYGCRALTEIEGTIITSEACTQTSFMFYCCQSLKSIDLSHMDTSSVTSFSQMFYACKSLSSLDVSNFNTESGTNFINMFSYCSSLIYLDLSNFTFNHNCGKVFNMVSECSSLETLDMGFDAVNLTDIFWLSESHENLTKIYLPYHLNISGNYHLPLYDNTSNKVTWYLSDGSEISTFPNLPYCRVAQRGSIPDASEDRLPPANDSGNWNDIDWLLQSGVLRLSSNVAGGAAMPDIDGDKVPSIPWFQYRNQIKKIIIGEGITHIGNYTFSSCHQVKEIEIAEGVTSIGKCAFYKCTALEKIAIPSSVTQIGTWAFADNEALKTITIPEGVTEIGEMMFQGCSVLDNIYIPSTVTKIGLDAFVNCKNLETIRFGGLQQEWERIDFHTSVKKRLDNCIIWFSDGSFYQKTEYAGEFSYINSSNESIISKYTYSCNLKHFLQSSYNNYQHDLTQMSIRVAMSAMGTGDGTGIENIRSLMDDMGFHYTYIPGSDDEGSIHYVKPDGNDTIGYAIGRKKIISTDGNENTLILVAVRGGGYGNEWAGNFNIGMGTNHAGFETAAKQVKEGLSKFLKDEGIAVDSSVHVWICGYSRAAATSNLLAAKLDDGEIKGIIPKNVHAFCFECPQNTRAANVNDSLYSNIVNVVNPVDLVPMVAPNDNFLWKYTRYGQTYVLPAKKNTKTAKYKSLKRSMESCYKEIVEYRGESFDAAYTDVANKQSERYEKIVKNLTVFVTSPEEYTVEMQSKVYDAVYDYYTDNTKPDWSDIFDIIWRTVLRVYLNSANTILKKHYESVIEETLVDYLITKNNIRASHYPELCLAWVDSLEGDTETFIEKRSYYEVYINCPVNVEVYENAALVGAIYNDTPQEVTDGVETYIDDNGQKVLVLPGDGNFEIKLDSYDDGNVTYTVASFEGTESVPSQLVSYYEVAMEDKSELTGIVSEPEISLKNEDGTSLPPSIMQNGDEIKPYILELSSEGNGAAIGEGAYNPGEYVKLIAIADTEAEFLGWKIGGEIVSMDEEYRILMDGDKKITAVFSTTHDGIWSEGINDVVYTGSNITQSFRLYDGEVCLQEKVDYTVSYKNNKNTYTYTDEDYAGFENHLQITGKPTKFGSFDPKKAPQVIIKMKGNYSGSQAIYFRIQPANITDDSFSAANLAVTYSGNKQTPAPTVTWKGKTLKYNTDFYIPEYDNVSYDKTAFSNSGAYDLTVVGKNNFTGEIPITLTISESSKQIAMGSVTVKGVSNQVWTGQQIIPEGYTVKYKADVLSEANGDYTVSFGENTAAGTGTITLTGTGTDNDGDGYSYIGTKTISFKITGITMSKVTVFGVDKSYPYTGTAIEPSATLTYKANKDTDPVTLVKDTHYTVAYQKNQDKGTATIIFTGLESGGCTGTKKITFKIAASGIIDKVEGGNPVEQIQITYKDTENVRDGIYIAPYMKGGAKPEVIVTSGSRTLKSGKDYTVSYANNKKIALSTDKKAPTITVKGKGNYSGSKKITFSIAVKPLSEENGITVTAKDKVVSAKKNGYRQCFKVYDADGKALGSSDYDSKNVIYTLFQTKNEDGTMNDVNKVLDQNSIVPAESVIRITVQGKGNYIGGSVSGTYRILEAGHDISKATIQINNQEYTGKPVMITDQSQFKPNKVYIKIGKETKTLTLGEDIEVVPDSYVKNVNKGTAKVTFRGIHDFGGTKTVSYKIGARSITDFWRGIFGKIKGLMAYNETRIAFPKYVARMT